MRRRKKGRKKTRRIKRIRSRKGNEKKKTE
jgi:hypothetical protein